jgi:nicotinate-nucleotide adenylyltransferase
MRLVFGGSFDPVHFGHLRPLLEVQQRLAEAYAAMPVEIPVHLIPCAQPVHRASPIAAAEHRVAMLQLAIQDQPGWQVDTREIVRGGESYMIDTLRAIKKDTTDFVSLVLGADAFAGFMSWREPEQIVALANIIVCDRPDAPALEIPTALAGVLKSTENPLDLEDTEAGLLWQAPVSQLQISSTAVRQSIDVGFDARYWLPDAVRDYINERGLYRL